MYTVSAGQGHPALRGIRYPVSRRLLSDPNILSILLSCPAVLRVLVVQYPRRRGTETPPYKIFFRGLPRPSVAKFSPTFWCKENGPKCKKSGEKVRNPLQRRVRTVHGLCIGVHALLFGPNFGGDFWNGGRELEFGRKSIFLARDRCSRGDRLRWG